MSVAQYRQDSIVCGPVDNTQDPFDTIGYVPILSTVSGFIRAGCALTHIISSVVQVVFRRIVNKDSLQEWTLKDKNIQLYFYQLARGLTEIVPLIGNLAIALFDIKQLKLCNSKLENKLDEERLCFNKLNEKYEIENRLITGFKQFLNNKEKSSEVSHSSNIDEKNNEIEILSNLCLSGIDEIGKLIEELETRRIGSNSTDDTADTTPSELPALLKKQTVEIQNLKQKINELEHKIKRRDLIKQKSDFDVSKKEKDWEKEKENNCNELQLKNMQIERLELIVGDYKNKITSLENQLELSEKLSQLSSATDKRASWIASTKSTFSSSSNNSGSALSMSNPELTFDTSISTSSSHTHLSTLNIIPNISVPGNSSSTDSTPSNSPKGENIHSNPFPFERQSSSSTDKKGGSLRNLFSSSSPKKNKKK